MEQIEFTGKTTEEAIDQASQHFNLPLNRLEVEVVHSGTGGFLGLFGAKKAVVRVRPQEATAESDVAEVMRELNGGNGGQRSARQSRSNDRPGADRQSGDHPNSEDTRQVEEPEVVDSAKQVLARLLQDLDDQAEVKGQATRHGIMLDIESPEAGILIGRRGLTLEAIQYLVTRIVSHQQGRPVRIRIDAAGYRRRRRESLEEVALRMAEKARQTGRSQAVGPFTAQERRVVHMTLRNESGIATASRGRGELKKVIISPRNGRGGR